MAAAVSERAERFPWWLVLIQGIATLLIGIFLIISPGMTTVILIQFLGIYWLIDGIFSIIRIFIKTTDTHWGWLLFRGVLGIIAGFMVINNPLWSTVLIPTILVLFLGIYGIVGGIIGLIEAFQGGGWGAGILGVIGLIFGLILVFNSVVGAIALPFVAGLWAIVAGIAAIVLAFRLR